MPPPERKPLPEPEEIQRRWVESNLHFIALAQPHFSKARLRRFFYYPSDFLGKLRCGRHRDSFSKILEICRTAKFPSTKSFSWQFDFGEGESVPEVYVEPRAGAEWSEVVNEARALLGRTPTEALPRKNSQFLLQWAATVPKGQQAEMSDEELNQWSFNDAERAVGHAQEIDPRLYLASKDDCYSWTIGVAKLPFDHLLSPGINELLPVPSTDEFGKEQLDAFVARVYEVVLSREDLAGNSSLVLLKTSLRADLIRCLGEGLPWDHKLCEFLNAVRLIGMHLRWDLDDHAPVWRIWLTPYRDLDWAQVRELISKRLAEEPSEDKYGLCPDAAKLFDWLRSLDPADFEYGLTPVVEDAWQNEIGIESSWEEKNHSLLIELLCEEISQKTGRRARPRPWHHWGDIQTRIQFE